MKHDFNDFFSIIKARLKSIFHKKLELWSENQSEDSQNSRYQDIRQDGQPYDSRYQDGRQDGQPYDSRYQDGRQDEQLYDSRYQDGHQDEQPYDSWYQDGRQDEQLYDTHPPHALTDNIEHILECRNLVKRFGRKVAVRGVNISMKTRQITGLLGPNGAGKTTIFYMIVGFIQPNGGGVYLDHHLLSALPMHKRALLGIAYLPQEPSVFRKLTVEQNIWAILETRGDLSREQKKEELESLLSEFGIHKIRKQFAYTLSGGERRRTEIARALAIKPKFLLLDEPFAGIDPIAVHEIKEIVRQLKKKGIGVLITDHNVRDTLEITDEAHIIHQGEVLISGPREKILESNLAREIYLGENFRM